MELQANIFESANKHHLTLMQHTHEKLQILSQDNISQHNRNIIANLNRRLVCEVSGVKILTT